MPGGCRSQGIDLAGVGKGEACGGSTLSTCPHTLLAWPVGLSRSTGWGAQPGNLIRLMNTGGIWISPTNHALQYWPHSSGRYSQAISTLNEMTKGPRHASLVPSELDSISYSALCARTGPSSLGSARSPS